MCEKAQNQQQQLLLSNQSAVEQTQREELRVALQAGIQKKLRKDTFAIATFSHIPYFLLRLLALMFILYKHTCRRFVMPKRMPSLLRTELRKLILSFVKDFLSGPVW